MTAWEKLRNHDRTNGQVEFGSCEKALRFASFCCYQTGVCAPAVCCTEHCELSDGQNVALSYLQAEIEAWRSGSVMISSGRALVY